MSPKIDLEQEGAPEEAWLAYLRQLQLPELDLSSLNGVVVVAPHPDDEVLGCGGLCARLRRSGRSVTIVAVTDGEAAWPSASAEQRKRLGELRRQEQRRALDRLGNGIRLVRLGIPDGEIEAAEEELADRLCHLLAPGPGPEAPLCMAPWRSEGHPDHEAAARAAATACEESGTGLLEYLVWAWHWASPVGTGEPGEYIPWPRAAVVSLGTLDRSAKVRALSAHASQVTDREGVPALLSAGFVAHFRRPFEVYLQ